MADDTINCGWAAFARSGPSESRGRTTIVMGWDAGDDGKCTEIGPNSPTFVDPKIIPPGCGAKLEAEPENCCVCEIAAGRGGSTSVKNGTAGAIWLTLSKTRFSSSSSVTWDEENGCVRARFFDPRTPENPDLWRRNNDTSVSAPIRTRAEDSLLIHYCR